MYELGWGMGWSLGVWNGCILRNNYCRGKVWNDNYFTENLSDQDIHPLDDVISEGVVYFSYYL